MSWGRGHRLGLDIIDGAIVMFSSVAGPHTVGDRCELVLPAPARRMADIEVGTAVVLAAFVALDALVVHPATVVARMLSDLHAPSAGHRDAR